VGFLDALLGRTKPVPPNLDALFAVPSAAITLQAATDFTPTGTGSVCFHATEGKAFSDIEKDVRDLLNMGENQAPVEVTEDKYGFIWVLCHHSADDIPGLVTDLHAVNTSLEGGGFGSRLLCTVVGFRDGAGHPLGLVYLYKRGTFYPFAPQPGQRRDNATELQVRGVLGDDLKIEPDLERWLALWDAPGV
jgi:PspA associated protein B